MKTKTKKDAVTFPRAKVLEMFDTVRQSVSDRIVRAESHAAEQAVRAVIKRHFPHAENCPDTVEKYEIHALMKSARAEELKDVLFILNETVNALYK